jgi:hypothetical protein
MPVIIITDIFAMNNLTIKMHSHKIQHRQVIVKRPLTVGILQWHFANVNTAES